MKETRKTENATSVGRRYYHPGQKDYATFLETSEETGGDRTLIEIELAPGGGNTPHYHLTYDEHFEVLEGALEVQLGKASRILRPGDKAVAYKTVLHRFRNPSGEPARFLVELRPGHAGLRRRSRSPTAWPRTASPPPTARPRTPTTWRWRSSGAKGGCPGSSPSSSPCSGC